MHPCSFHIKISKTLFNYLVVLASTVYVVFGYRGVKALKLMEETWIEFILMLLSLFQVPSMQYYFWRMFESASSSKLKQKNLKSSIRPLRKFTVQSETTGTTVISHVAEELNPVNISIATGPDESRVTSVYAKHRLTKWAVPGEHLSRVKVLSRIGRRGGQAANQRAVRHPFSLPDHARNFLLFGPQSLCVQRRRQRVKPRIHLPWTVINRCEPLPFFHFAGDNSAARI